MNHLYDVIALGLGRIILGVLVFFGVPFIMMKIWDWIFPGSMDDKGPTHSNPSHP